MAEQSAFSGDLLYLLQSSARSGTLLSSCNIEVHELMHQLDVHITSRCKWWEEEVTRLNAELLQSQRQTDRLSAIISAKTAQMEKFEKSARSKEREYQVRIADYEAQLLRLSSEVSRITRNYAELRKRRYLTGPRLHSDATTQTQVRLLQGELERMNTQMHLTEELRKQNAQLTELQIGSGSGMGNKGVEHGHTFTHAGVKKWVEEGGVRLLTSKSLDEFAEGLDKVLAGKGVHWCRERASMEQDVGQEQSSSNSVHSQPNTVQLVDSLLDRHIKQLNHDLLQVLQPH